MPESGEVLIKHEPEHRPDVLWRAFTVDPRMLSAERLSQPLVPGTSAEDDPTRIGDGNELGVYMSTNRNMVETAYAHNSGALPIKGGQFNDNGLMTNIIDLPQCGVVVKVDTNGLAIRPPKIVSYLQGHYNNGFEGDEWIADEVSPEHYKVVRLVLSRHANDNERMDFDINEADRKSLEEAVDKIKAEFEVREQRAREFASVIESLDPNQRRSSYAVRNAWKQYVSAKEPR